MELNKKENILIGCLVFLVTLSATKVFGGYLQDKVTKNTCRALDGVYMVGAHIGEGYCDNK